MKQISFISKKGFTLIELMIVIAVVAVLTTFILVALSGAREAAEDSKRKGAISQIRSFSSVHYSLQGGFSDLENANELSDIIDKYDINTGEEKVLKIISGASEFCAEIELVNGTYSCTDGRYLIIDGYDERRCETGSVNCDAL
jgi:prepilin-type N-terminal cleavage/methylation domain-containing protein